MNLNFLLRKTDFHGLFNCKLPSEVVVRDVETDASELELFLNSALLLVNGGDGVDVGILLGMGTPPFKKGKTSSIDSGTVR